MTPADSDRERAELEAELREHARARSFDVAITRAFEGYGGELRGYLHAVQPSSADADEAFSELCERAWPGLPSFSPIASFQGLKAPWMVWLMLVGASACAHHGSPADSPEKPQAQTVRAPDDQDPPADPPDSSAIGAQGIGLIRPLPGGEGNISLGETGLLGSADGRGMVVTDHGPDEFPWVRVGRPEVQGLYDKNVIRRLVRAHINEIRSCYSQGLLEDPSLSGTVDIRFIIGPEGDVRETEVASSTLAKDAVAECVANAVARWRFPKPTRGDVTIINPFVFERVERRRATNEDPPG